MNSFLIVSTDTKKKDEYVSHFHQDNHISQFDQIVIKSESSIGIELIRKLQEMLYIKPYKGEKKTIVIENADTLTIEAQNALLKILEEPPLYVFLFLLSSSQDILLPTILSRCQIVLLGEEKKALSHGEEEIFAQQIAILEKGNMQEKLALAETIASEKENLKAWFEQITLFAREKMLNSTTRKDALFLLQLHNAYKIFSTTNVNVRVLLEHTFLSL